MENKMDASKVAAKVPLTELLESPNTAVTEKKKPGPKSKIELQQEEIEKLRAELAEQKKQAETTKKIIEPVDERTPLEKKIAAMKEDGMTPITGYFRYIERPGDYQEFVFKKFKGQSLDTYKLYDGVFTTIPKCVGEHINKTGKYPVNKRSVDESGKPVEVVDKYMQRFEFISSALQQDQQPQNGNMR